jgi:hypothetical protein
MGFPTEIPLNLNSILSEPRIDAFQAGEQLSADIGAVQKRSLSA